MLAICMTIKRSQSPSPLISGSGKKKKKKIPLALRDREIFRAALVAASVHNNELEKKRMFKASGQR